MLTLAKDGLNIATLKRNTHLEIEMTNQDVYKMFVDATNAYIEKLREIKEMDMINSIDISGLIDQLHDEMFEVESELLDYDDMDE